MPVPPRPGAVPDDIKVLFLIYPFIGETTEEAWAKYHRLVQRTRPSSRLRLAAIGTVTDIDFSQFDLDKELPHADHQWRAGIARQIRAMGQRQDAAPACLRAV